MILDRQTVTNKKFELYLENKLLDKKIEYVRAQLRYSGLLSDDQKKFLENELRNLELKRDYNNIERGFLDERQIAGNVYLNSLQFQDNALKNLEGSYSDLIKKTSEWEETLKEIEPLYKPLGKLFGETGKELGKMAKEAWGFFKKGDIRGVFKSLAGSYISIVVDRFVELQTAAENFRKATLVWVQPQKV